MRSSRGGLDCRLEPLPAAPLSEFVLYAAATPQLKSLGWPCGPGEVLRDEDAPSPVLLHFAPARWLVDRSSARTSSMLASAVATGAGASIDVEGKWRALRLAGMDATRALASTIDIEALLHGRGCVAVTLFDCPAIVVRATGGYGVWVSSSHAVDFAAAIARQN
jgi:sarcosine oxidase gamma subunit